MSKKNIYSRNRPIRTPAKILYLFCEGEKTEPNYFCAIHRKYRDILRDKFSLQIKDTFHTDPIGLVEEAKDLLRLNETQKGDIIWCVFDVNNNNNNTLNNAFQRAGKKIQIALSNPCFEVWYILHFKYSTASIRSSEEAVSILKEYIPNYEKNCDVLDTLSQKPNSLADAINGSKQLNDYHETSGNNVNFQSGNPSTQVFKIIELLGIHKY